MRRFLFLTFILTILLTIDGGISLPLDKDDKDHKDDKDVVHYSEYHVYCEGEIHRENLKPGGEQKGKPNEENPDAIKPLDGEPQEQQLCERPAMEGNPMNLENPNQGKAHGECKETLTERVRTVMSTLKGKKSKINCDILHCLEDYCCTQKDDIDDRLPKYKTIDDLLAKEEAKVCKRKARIRKGTLQSFFG